MSQFLDHFHVVLHTFLDALCFDAVTLFLEEGYLLHQVVLDLTDGDGGLFLRGHEKVGGVELVILETRQPVESHGVHFLNAVDLVVPESHTEYNLAISHCNVDGITLHTEVAALQVDIVTYIESGYQIP